MSCLNVCLHYCDEPRVVYMIMIILDNNNTLLQFQLINIHVVSFAKYVLR